MISLGLRLAVNGGRDAITRLVILAVAVGIGVGLLLSAVAATNAVNAWSGRHAWYWTGTAWEPSGPATGVAPLWWRPASDVFDGQKISRFDVAATGASSPVPPGIRRNPGPGQYYASPALAALLRSTPADQLANRYPGHLAGVIGDAGLPSPDSLAIIIGHSPALLAHTPGSVQVTSIATTVPGNPGDGQWLNAKGLRYVPPDGGIQTKAMDFILSVVALAILTPVLIFIATATRLSAARREQRFAAMRLVGASRSQVTMLAAIESTLAGVAGVAAGFGIFFGLRVPVASIPFLGQPFFPSELSLSLPQVLAVAIGVPVAAAVVARLALNRVHLSPLGVARRTTPGPLRAWRILPLLAGLAELGFWGAVGNPGSTGGQVEATGSGFLLIIVGLFIAGPWLTMVAAGTAARWTRRPGTLIAARRLADDPRAAFRSVSGLVLALLITTVAVVAITTQDAKNLTRWGGASEANVLTDQVSNPRSGIVSPGTNQAPAGPGPAAGIVPLTAQLRTIAGVHGVVVLRADAGLTIPAAFHNLGAQSGSTRPGSIRAGGGPVPSGPVSAGPVPAGPIPAAAVSCAQLATVPALGRCPAGATAVAFPAGGFGVTSPLFGKDTATIIWPAANVPAARLETLGVDAIDVGTDGSTATVERARTLLENARAYPAAITPSTISDIIAQDNSKGSDYRQLANTVILVSLLIAGCTLAAGIAAGLADRKRPFSMLRLTGARLATLHRVVAIEGGIPLLAGAAVAIGTGFGAAAMFASATQHHAMVAPGPAYYLLTAGGIVASLGIVAATFPLLARITGPEVARNE